MGSGVLESGLRGEIIGQSSEKSRPVYGLMGVTDEQPEGRRAGEGTGKMAQRVKALEPRLET